MISMVLGSTLAHEVSDEIVEAAAGSTEWETLNICRMTSAAGHQRPPMLRPSMTARKSGRGSEDEFMKRQQCNGFARRSTRCSVNWRRLPTCS